jgi:hypothetical protein
MLRGRTTSIVALAASLLFGAAHRLQAATIYDQTTDGTAGGFFSDPNTGFTVLDDFTLGSGATIQSISWVGGVSNLTNPVTGFTISIFASTTSSCDGSEPSCPTGSALYSTTISNNANQSFLKTDAFNFSIYNYATNINFSASGSTEYWISIVANIAPGTGWIWESSNTGTPADGFSYQPPCPNCAIAVDEAFALSDTPLSSVPEPSSTMLVSGGLALLAFAARRVQRS